MLHFRCFHVLREKTKCKIMNRRRIALICCILMGCLACLAQNVVEVKKPGTLGSLLTQEQQDTCTTLILEGKLNSSDIKVLRHMAGYQEEGCQTGCLRGVDLSRVTFVSDKKPYLVLDTAQEHMMGYANNSTMNNSSIGSYELVYGHSRFDSGGSRHWPTYELGCPSNGENVAVGITFPNIVSFDFTVQFNWVDRQMMRKYEMRKFKGHKIEWDGTGYQYTARTHKDVYFTDMFYKCPQMRVIILNNKKEISKNVIVHKERILYSSNPEDLAKAYD